jgi:hypothetical protein
VDVSFLSDRLQAAPWAGATRSLHDGTEERERFFEAHGKSSPMLDVVATAWLGDYNERRPDRGPT